ncbi:MAG: hypothetical protein EA422_07340 [Gemmatimonadales bacterium]|nr:MAG: hypothetical protein EA422_07340 [Gemmatimonadales bacterium]
MPDTDLIVDLARLNSAVHLSEALLSAARSLAALPVLADQPSGAMVTITDALSAQQEALQQIQDILQRITE